MSPEHMESMFVRPSLVSELSLNLVGEFVSTFNCWLTWTWTVPSHFLPISFLKKSHFFPVFFRPYVSKYFEMMLLLQIPFEHYISSFQACIFFSMVFLNVFSCFWNFEVSIHVFHDFLFNVNMDLMGARMSKLLLPQSVCKFYYFWIFFLMIFTQYCLLFLKCWVSDYWGFSRKFRIRNCTMQENKKLE